MSDSKQWHGGKGSYRRNENNNAYSDGWDAIFNKQVESKDLVEKEDECSPEELEEMAIREESAMDRYERHMESIRRAQASYNSPVAHMPPFDNV